MIAYSTYLYYFAACGINQLSYVGMNAVEIAFTDRRACGFDVKYQMPFQGVNVYAVWYSYPGCRFACPGLCSHWAFSPLYLNQKRIFIVYILLFAAIMSSLNIFCCEQYCCYMSNSHCLFSKSLTTALNPEPPERVGTGIVSMSSSTVITPPRNSRLTWSVTSKTKVESLPL